MLAIKFAAAALSIVLCAPTLLLAQQAPARQEITPEQRKAMERVVRDYLLKNPEVIRDAMQALSVKEQLEKQKQTAAALKQHQGELVADAASPVGGNPSGDVTVVEFFDYNCGYCKQAAPTLAALIARDANVRVVYKEFPILAPQSFVASRAALAATRQGKYVEFHHALMAAEQTDEATIKAVAVTVGLDHAKLLADMQDPALGEMIERNHRLAAALEINGTPAFVVGDRVIPGAVDVESLSMIVSAERAKPKGVKGGKRERNAKAGAP